MRQATLGIWDYASGLRHGAGSVVVALVEAAAPLARGTRGRPISDSHSKGARPTMKQLGSFTLILLIALSTGAQTPSRKRAPAKAAPAASAVPQPRYKAIWEPVPFTKDIDLNAITCMGAETCWVAGDNSTILYTADGGKNWQIQLGGDPEAREEDLVKIFFLDNRNGWAMTDRARLFHTSDGSTWSELGKLSGTSKGVWFVSAQSGFEVENPDSTTQTTLQHSQDGGKSWKAVDRCTVNTSIDGLPRKLECRMGVAQFLSPAIGFMGGGAAINMATEVAAFAKTAVIPDTKWPITAVHFWSEKDGFVVLKDGKALWTADGGGSWTGTANAPQWLSHYGGAQGQIVGVHEDGSLIAYSFNGGRNFTSRPFKTPARVQAVTFFDRQHGYLVGEHGMVYRYRIVPADYSAPGMIAALAP